ncbi:MAG: ABC transporter [Crocinitomicaceae bacterium]|nr:ABC transporter [Crocinitomicaceae bacterium]|tara:strand:+ start:47905 stop:49182 length:1278 start_codon:yes stop_codon:yes gene_type:complete
MIKLLASIKKEFLILIYDKIGLLLMYVMPILLVFIITIVQDSTFKLVNENKIEINIINNDKGNLGDTLISLLKSSGSFKINKQEKIRPNKIKEDLLNNNHLLSIEIPKEFSKNLKDQANYISSNMLEEFGISENTSNNNDNNLSNISLYYDPVVQESFRFSMVSSIYSYLNLLENRLMIQSLYAQMDIEKNVHEIKNKLNYKKLEIKEVSANTSSKEIIPNSTQHNVPAWSIFAMFFMVISLGGNIVKERTSGSFIRLQTTPSSFSLVILSKMFVYFFVALTQLTIIFLIGKYIFPLIELPKLSLPSNIFGLIIISSLSALAAISFAVMVGTYSKTREQASGFGAVTVIILAAIGGIWVPSFVMPYYLQQIGKISPMHWSLEGFYALFLKGGDWYLLFPTIIFLILFILVSQFFTFVKLKTQNYI